MTEKWLTGMDVWHQHKQNNVESWNKLFKLGPWWVDTGQSGQNAHNFIFVILNKKYGFYGNKNCERF